ncbi:MAG: hypothetical protein QM820_26055 [Minicystis sp.]
MSNTRRPAPEQRARARADFFARLDAVLEEANTSAEAEAAAMDFEPWARLSIRLFDAGAEERAAVLAARGISSEAWARADTAWLRALAADLRAGERGRAEAYASRLADARGNAAAVLPPPGPTPAAIKETAEAANLPGKMWAALGRLPFVEPTPGAAANGAEVGTGRKPEATQPVPVWPKGKGQTIGLGGEAQHLAYAAALPFGGATAGRVGDAAAVVYFPALTIKQYVSLRAELWVRSEAREEALRRYGVPSVAAFQALEADWAARVRASPALRAELDAAVAEAATWLRGPG